MTLNSKEIKKKRFKTVASKRVQKVLDSIENLSKCANKNNYEYEEEDVRKMFKVIGDSISLLRIAYTANSKSGKQTFEF